MGLKVGGRFGNDTYRDRWRLDYNVHAGDVNADIRASNAEELAYHRSDYEYALSDNSQLATENYTYDQYTARYPLPTPLPEWPLWVD